MATSSKPAAEALTDQSRGGGRAPHQTHYLAQAGSIPAPATSVRDEIATAAQHGYPYYVYTLADAEGVFYVGKGKGSRMFDHGRTPGDRNGRKLERIAAGPVVRSIDAFFSCSRRAFAHESALIRAGRDRLTNVKCGGTGVDPREAQMARARALLAQVERVDRDSLSPVRRTLHDIVTHVAARESVNPTPASMFFDRSGMLIRQVWA